MLGIHKIVVQIEVIHKSLVLAQEIHMMPEPVQEIHKIVVLIVGNHKNLELAQEIHRMIV